MSLNDVSESLLYLTIRKGLRSYGAGLVRLTKNITYDVLKWSILSAPLRLSWLNEINNSPSEFDFEELDNSYGIAIGNKNIVDDKDWA